MADAGAPRPAQAGDDVTDGASLEAGSQPATEAAAPTSDAPVRGLRVLGQEEFSLTEAVGGVRGLVETSLPGLVFVVVYVATKDLTTTLVASAALAVLAVVVRLVQRTPVTQALSGLVGVGIGVAWAWWTGRAENYFAGGLLANAGYLVGVVLSVVVRWPVVGIVVALLRGEDMGWRTDPARAAERRRFVWATWVLAAVFAIRLVVQVPLYLAGEVEALGTAKLVLGVPLFALGLWLTWLLVAGRGARGARTDRSPTPPR